MASRSEKKQEPTTQFIHKLFIHNFWNIEQGIERVEMKTQKKLAKKKN